MQLNYILNNQKLNIPSTVIHNAATAVANGTLVTITGQDAVVIDVTGTFVATLYVAFKYNSGTFETQRDIYNLDTGEKVLVPAITAPGKYLVRNLSGYDVMRVRVDRYTSGEITVKACSADINSIRDVFSEKPILKSTAIFTDATGNVGSADFKTANSDCILLSVSGTFSANLIMYGTYSGGSAIRTREIYNIENPLVRLDSITEAGTYAVKNLTRFDTMKMSVLNYASGSFTVRVCSTDINTIFKTLAERNRQVLIKAKTGITLAANATDETNELDLSPYAFVYALVRTDSAHSIKVYVGFRTVNNTLGSTVPETEMVSGVIHRTSSEWVEVKGTRGVFGIKNTSDTSHTYDVFYYGVR